MYFTVAKLLQFVLVENKMKVCSTIYYTFLSAVGSHALKEKGTKYY